ncbi:MAG: SPOR domain-containing protein [Nitrospirota bacterium]
MNNQRGGIISKVFLIPAGVVVIISVFIAGYFVGREQGRQSASTEKPPALPDMVSQYLPKKEDFTFYKTLTEKGDKTVSIELKPKQKTEETAAPKKEQEGPPAEEGRSTKQKSAKPAEVKAERPAAPQVKPLAARPRPQTAKKEPAPAKSVASKLRYTIQVGSYPEKAMADDEARNMKKKGFAAFVVATDLADKGKWFRVRIGSFSNKQSAEKLAKELKSKEGIDGFITAE